MEDSKKIKDSLKQIPTKEEVKEEVGRMKEQLQTQVDDLAAELRDLKKVYLPLCVVNLSLVNST